MDNKSKKIVLCGYYGRKNFGDEAILSVLLKKIEQARHKKGKNTDIRILKNRNPRLILSALFGGDVFLFGGGSLLQNSTSDASLFYYLTLISAAKLTCKHRVMLSNGIGPVNDGFLPQNALLRLTARTVNTFDIISVRDRSSQVLLKKLLPNRSVSLLPDPAFVFFQKESNFINQRLIKSNENQNKEKYFAFIPCALGLKKAKISVKELSISLNAVKNQFNASPLIIILNVTEDARLSHELAYSLKGNVITPKDTTELTDALCKAEFVVSMRYHGSLFASGCGIPLVSVSEDPKMQGLCADTGLLPPFSFEIFRDTSKKSSSSKCDRKKNCKGKNNIVTAGREKNRTNESSKAPPDTVDAVFNAISYHANNQDNIQRNVLRLAHSADMALDKLFSKLLS